MSANVNNNYINYNNNKINTNTNHSQNVKVDEND